MVILERFGLLEGCFSSSFGFLEGCFSSSSFGVLEGCCFSSSSKGVFFSIF